MSSARSDASTSTDDVKARPLCLFYFASPFGVLSSEPPRVCDMQRAAPWCWPPPAERSPATGAGLELGAATVHARPVRLAPDLWLEPAPRRLHPLLPPLRLPSARVRSARAPAADVWPRRAQLPERFSLPPIELPAPPCPPSARTPSPATAEPSARELRARRLGVDKQRRRRRVARVDVRRTLATLIRRPLAVQAVPWPRVARCGCVSLRAGAALAGAGGLALAALCAWQFSAAGMAVLVAAGVAPALAGGARLAHGAAAALLAAAHASLLVAAALRSPLAAELYLWAALLLALPLTALALTLASSAMLAGRADFAALMFAATVFGLALGGYSVVVVANYTSTLP